MGDSIKYWEERLEQETVSNSFSKDIINILDLFRLLSAEEKLKVKQLIKEEKIF